MEVSAETSTESATDGLKDGTQAEDGWKDTSQAVVTPTPVLIAGVRRSPAAAADVQQRWMPFSPAVVAAQLPQDIRLETLLLGAWSLLLHRYSGDLEIVLGVQFGGDRPLPLQVKIAPDMLLLPWLEQLQHQWQTLCSHRDLLSLKHDSAELTECFVILTEEAIAPATGSPYLLTLAVANDQLQVQFDRARLDESTLDRILGHLQTLLVGMAIDPQRRLVDLPLLTDAERQQLLDWAQNPVEYPCDRCIHHLFEAQVGKTPDAIALVLPGEVPRQLTYRQLDDRANLLAAQLQQQGVQRETLVAISMERSIELVVAILGVLKAGGVYVPIDPTYPIDRIAWMLADVQASIVLTQSYLVQQLPPASAQIVCLDADWGMDSAPIAFLSAALDATDLAMSTTRLALPENPKGSPFRIGESCGWCLALILRRWTAGKFCFS
ncbi:MAG: AMP-binding protein [Leptolyngbyaceae cyanobacterium SM1_3_5]|nr:AMP-binding protein [Leptolyngbyaceae cyanobacterium SM1_3_5]